MTRRIKRESKWPLSRQPAPPTPPAWATPGTPVTPTRPLDLYHGRTGTIRRIHAVPAGVYVDVDYGSGRTGTYRPQFIRPCEGS